jgi:hypothetical protein
MSQVAYIIDRKAGNVTVYVGAKPYTIDRDHCNYDTVLDRLRTKEYDDLEELLDIPKAIASASKGKVIIENGSVYYNGKEIHNVIAERILDFMNEGFPFEPLALFLENLLQNPLESAIKELYLFLESGKLPITDDGCFLAYKKVDENFQSYHASPDGSHLGHPIGGIVSMPREDVDDCRDRTCSRGLHFCSLSYLSCYSGGSGKVIIVKINPRDVVAIPSDYNNAKGRASQYEVMAEYDAENREEADAFEDSYVDTQDGEDGVREAMAHVREEKSACADDCGCEGDWGTKPNGQRYNNKRDNNGRFTKRNS